MTRKNPLRQQIKQGTLFFWALYRYVSNHHRFPDPDILEQPTLIVQALKIWAMDEQIQEENPQIYGRSPQKIVEEAIAQTEFGRYYVNSLFLLAIEITTGVLDLDQEDPS